MKEELLKLYKEFLDAFNAYTQRIHRTGGYTSRKPDFQEFMNWVDKGYIED